VVPAGGLDEVVVEEKLMLQLREIVQFEKARYVTIIRCYIYDVRVSLVQFGTLWTMGIW